MKAASQNEWSKFFKFFNEHNHGRPVRVAVYERDGDNLTDYWLSSGARFVGLDMDARADQPTIQVSLEGLTHEVSNATSVQFHLSCSGEEDGCDIKDAAGRTTVLRFETMTASG